jgi:hypothetical protein
MSATETPRRELGRLANNGMAVQSLQASLSQGGTIGNTVPALIKQMAVDNSWRTFLFASDPATIYRWGAAEFRRFIEAPRAQGGCQTPLYLLERLLRGTDAWGVFLDLTRGEPGGDNNPEGRNQYAREEEVKCDSIILDLPSGSSEKPPTGTSVSYARRRLKRERPDLLEKVEAGEMTANAAMLKAGFREPQITIPLDPRKAARRLARHLSKSEFSELVDEALRIYAPPEAP